MPSKSQLLQGEEPGLACFQLGFGKYIDVMCCMDKENQRLRRIEALWLGFLGLILVRMYNQRKCAFRLRSLTGKTQMELLRGSELDLQGGLRTSLCLRVYFCVYWMCMHLDAFISVGRLMLRVDQDISAEMAIALVPAIARLVGTERLILDGKTNLHAPIAFDYGLAC